MNEDYRSLSELLESTKKRYKIQDHEDIGNLFNSYGEIVGEIINRFSKPKKFENGIFWIEVDNAALRHELFMMREKIKENINSFIKKELVKEIRLI